MERMGLTPQRRRMSRLKRCGRVLVSKARSMPPKTLIKLTLAALSLGFLIFLIVARLTQGPQLTTAQFNKLTFQQKFERKNLRSYPMEKRPIESSSDKVFESGCRDVFEEARKPRANAAFVVLARNSELDGVLSSMRSLERHFNQWFNYPWVFLNDEQFTDEFRHGVEEVASGPVRFGVIAKDRWTMDAEESDPVNFKEAVEEQGDRGIMYGNMAAYHRMCRFYSGHFFDHRLVRKLDWYWRVEPDVDFYCDLTYDPFIEMEKNGKKYGFTIMIKELLNTVPSLFRDTLAFARDQGIKLPSAFDLFVNNYSFYSGKHSLDYEGVKDSSELFKRIEKNTPLNYVRATDESGAAADGDAGEVDAQGNPVKASVEFDQFTQEIVAEHVKDSPVANENSFGGLEYNLCHFWSNFEIARVDLFRNPQYQKYYRYLEESGGFYMERWGDAPIHSLATGLFLDKSEVHYFRDIGYRHSTIRHCPANSPNQLPYKASENYKHGYSKRVEKYWAAFDFPHKDAAVATGCRCRCPGDHKDIENTGSSCTSVWAMVNDDSREPQSVYDLDRIEQAAQKLYAEFIRRNPDKGREWKLSGKDVEELKKLVVTT